MPPPLLPPGTKTSSYRSMADLIALDFIQYGFQQYKPGDTLPSDAPLAAVWIRSGTAMWRDTEPPKRTRAVRKTAMAGMPGTAVGGEATGDNLVGRVPETERRKRPQWIVRASKTS